MCQSVDEAADSLCVQRCARSPKFPAVDWEDLSHWRQKCCRRTWSLFCLGVPLQVRLTWRIFLPFTCRFLSMSQLASKSSSSSPKGLMSCSATCMWRAHSKGHHCHPCPFPCREKSGVMALEFQTMFFFPKGGRSKVEASQGLGDTGICNNSLLLTQPSCKKEFFFSL